MVPIHLRSIPTSTATLETYPHYELIEHLCKWIKPINYLEIGVRWGDTYNVINKYCENCYLVDIDFLDIEYSKNTLKFEMTSDEFFKNLNPNIKFDLAFIDGDHTKEQVIKDFDNTSRHIVDDGFVILHDTYPYSEKMITPSISNNAWEAMLYIKTHYRDEWEYLTLPFNPGVSILKKMKINRQLIWM